MPPVRRPARPKTQSGRTRAQPVRGAGAGTASAQSEAELKDLPAVVHRMRSGVERELALARALVAEAERYQRDTGNRARSDVRQLMFKVRLSAQKELDELRREIEQVRRVGAEIRKVAASIRMIRIAAQEELESQRQFTSAARIKALSLALKEETAEPARKAPVRLVPADELAVDRCFVESVPAGGFAMSPRAAMTPDVPLPE